MIQYMPMLQTVLPSVLTVPNTNNTPQHTDTADMLPDIMMTLLTCLIG